jgi:hypothetical protein
VWELDRLARAFPELQPGLLPILRRTPLSAFGKVGEHDEPTREGLLEAVKQAHRAAGHVRRRENDARRGADTLRPVVAVARPGPRSQRAGTVPHPAGAGVPLIVLVSCSDEKLNLGPDESAPASTVYVSSLFRLSLEYARTLTTDDNIRILSAKWGAIGVDEFIPRYDFRLHSLSKPEREAWGARVVVDLRREFGHGPLHVIVLAGDKYVEALLAGVRSEGARWTVELPFGDRVGERLHIGERLKWLRGELDRAGSPARLPEAGTGTAGSPEEDLAAMVTFLREMATLEETRAPTHHRPQPHQDRIAAVLRHAAATIQRRRLDRRGAITYLRGLTQQWDDGVERWERDDIYLASDRLLTAAKGIERGKHLKALRTQGPTAPTEASPS